MSRSADINIHRLRKGQKLFGMEVAICPRCGGKVVLGGGDEWNPPARVHRITVDLDTWVRTFATDCAWGDDNGRD